MKMVRTIKIGLTVIGLMFISKANSQDVRFSQPFTNVDQCCLRGSGVHTQNVHNCQPNFEVSTL